MNLVVIQIEGLFYDMFVDANIQNRLDGQFDLFEKDDLKSKMEKNDTSMGLEEAALYFKFYFNSMIRNKVAHGRNCFKEEEYERISFELLLDLQYENFWDYVLKYIQSYDEQEIPHIKLKQEFKSRVKAMQEYIAKNKRQTLPLVSEVSKTMETMQLHAEGQFIV